MGESCPACASKCPSRLAALGIVLGLGSLAGLAASAVGYRLGWWQVAVALKIAEWAAYAAMAGVAASMLGVIMWRPGRRKSFVLAMVGFAASLPVAVAAMNFEYAARVHPPINDVSTDIDDPPVFWDMPNPTEYPRAQNAAQQRAAYPDLTPVRLPVAPERIYELASALVRENGWEVVAEEPEDGRIEAVDRTFLFGFKDEIVLRIAAADGGTRIDMRSRSRTGRIDRGVNAKRVRDFLSTLQQRAGGSRM